MDWLKKLKKKFQPKFQGEEYVFKYRYEYTERDVYKRLKTAVEKVPVELYNDERRRYQIKLDVLILKEIEELLDDLDKEEETHD